MRKYRTRSKRVMLVQTRLSRKAVKKSPPRKISSKDRTQGTRKFCWARKRRARAAASSAERKAISREIVH